jgi:cellulose synthase/poly-beta-1,6-N-acetylglucosamine synthase-like glycosyltransferase
MIQLDTITILFGAKIIVFALLTMYSIMLTRRVRHDQPEEIDETTLPPISIIITAHDEGYELSRNLESILTQQYTPGFEVIVVNAASTDDTADVLKRWKSKYTNLYTTFTPDSSKYMSRKKLAITLGAKAAHNDWVIIMDADCAPNSEQWLTSVGRHCAVDKDIVLIYSNYDTETSGYHRYERMLEQSYMFRKAQRGKAYRAATKCIAIRKGKIDFQSNLRYLRGEYDFLVNDNAEYGRSDVAFEIPSRVTLDEPSKKRIRNGHLYDIATIRHLKHTCRAYFSLFVNFMAATLFPMIAIADIILLILYCKWIFLAITAGTLLVFIIASVLLESHKIHKMKENVTTALIPFYEVRLLFSSTAYMLRYMVSNKRDFIRK